MGVKPSLIPPAVNAFIAQRLVRRLCSHCKKEYRPAKETVSSIKKILAIISPKSKIEIPKEIPRLYRPVGCLKCHNLGYKGRVAIFELLLMSEKIRELAFEKVASNTIKEKARKLGMVTLREDGIKKVLKGITTISEVMRVTQQDIG